MYLFFGIISFVMDLQPIWRLEPNLFLNNIGCVTRRFVKTFTNAYREKKVFNHSYSIHRNGK